MTSAVSRGEFRQFLQLSVRWGDADCLGHVNNANYFTYAESGRIQYFDALVEVLPGFWKEQGLILARIGCDFLAQVRYPSIVHLGTRIEKLGRTSMNIRTGMFVEDQAVAVANAVVVWFDYVAQKPAPIPDEVRQWIRQRETLPPQE